MFLASKIGWAGMAFILLGTGILVQAFPPSAAGSEATTEKVSAFVIKDEIKKMQETLRTQGHYRGKVDGVFGLRTRASLRAYQKAEKFSVTGQLDRRTADGLGVRPESTWRNSKSSGREVGHGRDGASGENKRDKPSAGIRRVERRVSNVSRKEVSRATPVEDNRRHGTNKQQSENEEHDR
jgi:peptidoglycan hydrolase-like protein with peptidoglycan-binding domain